MTITLEALKQEHDKLGQMIATFAASQPTTYSVPAAAIELAAGERYAGIVLGDDGKPLHHLILLPGEADDIEWAEAGDWAQNAGGALPTRQEQALLYANLKGQFQAAAYWSSEQPASNSDYAWYQSFSHGHQYDNYKGAEVRARAVRRLVIL